MKTPHMPNNVHLEPRVAKLEAGLEILTKSVSELTLAVRENSTSMEEKIERITVAVTQAQAPKKTDWSLFISTAFLILALGSAVFWPLNKTGQDNKEEIRSTIQKFEEHQKLNLHPVGSALLQRVEEQLQLHSAANENAMKAHVDFDNRQFNELDKKLQQEYALMMKTADTQIANLEAKINLNYDRIYSRTSKIEDMMEQGRNSELNELRLWRLRAMNGEIKGLSSISTDIVFDPHVPVVSEKTFPSTSQTK